MEVALGGNVLHQPPTGATEGCHCTHHMPVFFFSEGWPTLKRQAHALPVVAQICILIADALGGSVVAFTTPSSRAHRPSNFLEVFSLIQVFVEIWFHSSHESTCMIVASRRSHAGSFLLKPDLEHQLDIGIDPRIKLGFAPHNSIGPPLK